MVRRFRMGLRPGEDVPSLRVSKPGVDVDSASDEDLLFSSNLPTIHVLKTGSVVLPNRFSGSWVRVDFDGPLGFVPVVLGGIVAPRFRYRGKQDSGTFRPDENERIIGARRPLGDPIQSLYFPGSGPSGTIVDATCMMPYMNWDDASRDGYRQRRGWEIHTEETHFRARNWYLEEVTLTYHVMNIGAF